MPSDSTASAALKALADRVDHPLALVRDGRVWHLNRALCQVFGLATATDLIGRPFSELAAPDAVKPLNALLARTLLLEQQDETLDTLYFVPAAGPAFAAEVTAIPIDIAGRPGVAVQLDPTGAHADPRTAARPALAPRCGNDRPALLSRLAVLTDPSSAVERTSALAVVVVADYAIRRGRLGFGGATVLMESIAACLRAAAPTEATLYPVADDSFAVLVEDVHAPEIARLRRRLADATVASAEAPLRELRLQVGVIRVAPGSPAPAQLLDQALAEATPMATETTLSPETTEWLDGTETGYSVDTQASCTVTGTPGSALPGPPVGCIGDKLAASGGATGTTTAARLSPSSELGAGERVLGDDLSERIQLALEGEGFMLALQPIVSLMGDSREHYSVLVRLRRPDGGLASAAQIIRSSAGSGRMADIDRWVISSALRLLHQRRRGGEKAAFFLSLSPELLADEHLLIWLCDALRELDVRADWLTFQLQERHAVGQHARWAELIAGLREVRCRICVNELGLLDAPDWGVIGTPDFVKLAPTLASGLSGDRDKQRYLLDLIRRTRVPGTKTIVTGVEDARALNLLWDAGVEYVQGDYIQAPTTSLDLPTQAALVDEGQVDVESVRLSLRL